MATHEETNPNPTLPIDLIFEILSRLPAESLSELEDVCESWESLISSPEFIKTHLSKSTNDPTFAHHRLLLITWPWVEQANIPYMKLSSCSLSSLLNDETVPDPIKTCHLPPEVDNIDVVGYCNGLFCLTSRLKSCEQIFLWNPFTSESTQLPKHEQDEYRARGFCYDELNDDYKVFATFRQNVSVYSSKSGCWRIIGDYPSGEICGLGCFAKGAIHWLVERNNNMQSMHRKSEIIVSQDINTETYGEVPLPPKGEDGGSWTTTLDTFGESLSVLYSSYKEACSDFWVMKQCGAEESWTKLFTIPFIIGLPSCIWIKPLCISVSGEIILLSWATIVLYNPKDNTFKNLLTPEFCDDRLYVYTYVESLVSPP